VKKRKVTYPAAIAIASLSSFALNAQEITPPSPQPLLPPPNALEGTTNAAPSLLAPPPATAAPMVESNPALFATTGPGATSALGVPAFAPAAAAQPSGGLPGAYPLKWGPVEFHPHLDYGFTYGTGINFTPGNSETTALHSLSPGIALKTQHLTLDYTPTLMFYSKGSFEDTVNHNAMFSSVFGYDKWAFTLSHHYTHTFQPTIETATQTKTDSNVTGLAAHYAYSEKTSFDLSASQWIQDSEDFSSYIQWSTMDWVDYKVHEKTSLGVGVGGGYVDVDAGSDMTYEQIQARVGWRPGKKTALNLNGGVEIRQFLGSAGISDRVNPIMGASLVYAPFEATALSLQANRQVDTSLFDNQITESTSISASINQRFLAKVNLSVTAGYRTSDYVSTTTTASADRTDDYAFATAGIGTSIFKKGSVSAFYLRGHNSSSIAGFTYDTDQVTFLMGYHF
jgi:hypothetical protein